MIDFSQILFQYGIDATASIIKPFGSGLIHQTYLVETPSLKYILQKVNTNVFKHPEIISSNIAQADNYLKAKHPSYIFPGLVSTKSGKNLLYLENECWKLSQFINNTYTLNKLSDPEMAYQAAQAFAKLTKNLDGLPIANIKETIPNFHNLAFRYEQFLSSLERAIPERKTKANDLIKSVFGQKYHVETYLNIVSDTSYPIRMIHHDTKINNVLFDQDTKKSIAVCDLDTLMVGRIISDLGDMIRTYTCSENEDHTNPAEVKVLKEYSEALHAGYLNILGPILTKTEIRHIDFAGPFMIYMQAIRFLGDYLTGDTYYGAKYETHNYDRASNQMALLESLNSI
jgi:thiamine kinase-like enzyme